MSAIASGGREPDFAPASEAIEDLVGELYPGIPGAAHLLRTAAKGATPQERAEASSRLIQLDRERILRDRARNGGAALLDPDTWEEAGPHKARDMSAAPTLRAYPFSEFLELQLAPRQPLLLGPSGSAILREKDSGMVVAVRGGGKTWYVEGCALAVSTGGRFLRWRAAEQRRVLLVDGEMSAGALQDRLRLLLPSIEPAAKPDLIVLAADVQDEPMPSLASPAGQARIEAHLAGVSLLVLDNISTLFSTEDENDAAMWQPAQDWLLSLRRRGIATLLAHHAGRAGHARGTSRREDVLDVVIRLTQPTDYSPDQGARFEVRFDKARGLSGKDAEPFEAWLRSGEWVLADVAGRNYEAAIELFDQGARPNDVAEALGMARATAYRYQRQARKEGRLATPKARKR